MRCAKDRVEVMFEFWLWYILYMIGPSVFYIFDGFYMQDPEFYEFLKKHDNELLEFDEEELDVSSNTMRVCNTI